MLINLVYLVIFLILIYVIYIAVKAINTGMQAKNSNKLSKNVICLPFFTSLKRKEISFVVKTLLSFKKTSMGFLMFF